MTTNTRRARLLRSLVPLLALIPSVALHAQPTQPPQDFYIVDGKPIPLTPSPSYEAVELKPGTQRSFRAAAERTGAVAVEPSPVLERYDVVLLRRKPGAQSGGFRTGMRSLNRNAAVEAVVPVYQLGGIDQVLVNEFLVQFKADTARSAIEAYLRDKGAEIVTAPTKIPNRYAIRFPEKSPREGLAVVNGLTNDAIVTFAEPNFVRVVPERPRPGQRPAAAPGAVTPNTAAPPSGATGSVTPSPAVPGPLAPRVPNDTAFVTQWGLRNGGNPGTAGADISAPAAWGTNVGTDRVTIAIIDEGVDTAHPDLRDKIVTPYDATDQDDNQQPNAWDGHGTACAGIAAASSDNGRGIAGVSWGARILPVRIAFSNYQGGPWITTNAIIEDGIRTAVDRGAHVLSNSWGGGSPSSAINSGIDHAIANGLVVVFAAGNDAGPVSYPANLSPTRILVAVSASNEWDEFKTTTSQDGETWWGSNFGPQINVAAPGVHIVTTDISGADGYDPTDYVATFNGTSSATPFVAGAAAVLLAQTAGTPTQVRDWLQEGAKDLAPAGFDNRFGHGRLDLLGALDKAGGPLLVALDFPGAPRVLRYQRSTPAKVVVTSGGSPRSGVTVTFSSANTALATVSPTTAVTDGSGVAQAQVRGEHRSWFSKDVEIKAAAGSENGSRNLKVPAWPVWSLLLIGAGLLRSRRAR